MKPDIEAILNNSEKYVCAGERVLLLRKSDEKVIRKYIAELEALIEPARKVNPWSTHTYHLNVYNEIQAALKNLDGEEL